MTAPLATIEALKFDMQCEGRPCANTAAWILVLSHDCSGQFHYLACRECRDQLERGAALGGGFSCTVCGFSGCGFTWRLL